MIKIEEMRKKFRDKYVKIVPHSDKIDRIKELKKGSKDLPFDLCKFDDDGKCEQFRISGFQCQCILCDDICGWIRYTTEEDLIVYAEAYDEKYGFFRKGKGCVLPREYRSEICLSYYCEDNDKIKEYKKNINSIRG
jgi:hypothetical protein